MLGVLHSFTRSIKDCFEVLITLNVKKVTDWNENRAIYSGRGYNRY